MAEEGDEAPDSWSQARAPPLPRGLLADASGREQANSAARRDVKLQRMAEEGDDGADLWSQEWAPRSPLGPAKRHALDLGVSQLCSSSDSSMSQDSSGIGSAISDEAQAKAWGCAKRSRGGQWWSTELAAPVEIGVDFVPDSQDGGGNEFFFLPNSDESAEAHASRARSIARGHQRVLELRRLFPPLPSLVEECEKHAQQLRARSEKLELARKDREQLELARKDQKLRACCSITTSPSHSTDEDLLVHDESEAMVDLQSEPTSTTTW